MLVKLSFDEFMSLDSHSISWKCIEPITMQVRGKSFEERQKILQPLNKAQLATFMFYVYHNHINSIEEMYWFTQYYLSDIKIWPSIKASVRFYEDQELFTILEEVEHIVVSRNQLEDGNYKEARPSDLEGDAELATAIQAIYYKYVESAPRLISRMNTYVTQHLPEFIEIV